MFRKVLEVRIQELILDIEYNIELSLFIEE